MLHAPDRAPEIALLKATLISNELAVQNGDARRSSGTGGATWATFAAMPVVVADVPYGVIVLGSAKRRARPLNAADRNFVRLIGALAGSNIERASQHRRLDELAFSADGAAEPLAAARPAATYDRCGQAIRQIV